MSWFKDLVQNGSGVSSKSFFIVMIVILGCLLLLTIVFAIIFDVIKNGTITIDLSGLAIFMGSITALFGAGGLTKCLGERNERNEQC